MHTIIRYRTTGSLNAYETVLATARVLFRQYKMPPGIVDLPVQPVAAGPIQEAINAQLPRTGEHLRRSQVSHQLNQCVYYSQLIRVGRGQYAPGCTNRITISETMPWLHDAAWWDDGTVEDVLRDLVELIRRQQQVANLVPLKVWGWRVCPLNAPSWLSLDANAIHTADRIEISYTILS